jgi:hypothetical protein
MGLSGSEREILADLIGSVRTLAAQLVTLHLQVGAMRTALDRKGMVSEAEFRAAFVELEAISSTEEALRQGFPEVMEDVFEELLRRLERTATDT